MGDETFYQDLRVFGTFADVCDDDPYSPVPDSWDLVITDVQGSTQAIEEGRYKDVNSAGVASIVVVRNAMGEIEIPYVFGGDGATLLVPASRRTRLEAALRGLRKASRKSFGVEMRVGIVPVAQLRAAGHDIEVARYAASPDVSFAMLRGNGIDVGEGWVKDPERSDEFHVSVTGELYEDFKGFQCRWKPVPSRHGQVASIIVKALSPTTSGRAQTYKEVLDQLSKLVKPVDEGRPVARETLSLQSSRSNFEQEAKLTKGDRSEAEMRKQIRREVRIGKVMFATRIAAKSFNPREYRKQLIANTDFRKFDSVLRMHLDLTNEQLEALQRMLQEFEDRGVLVYGIHTADHTLMTCAIDSYQGSHAHFVDGAAGGYALAAKRIKTIMKKKKSAD